MPCAPWSAGSACWLAAPPAPFAPCPPPAPLRRTKRVGIVQSLLITCRLHGVAPYTYLVDVLQRVAEHPQSRVAELTPRLWKECFAENPLRSHLLGASV